MILLSRGQTGSSLAPSTYEYPGCVIPAFQSVHLNEMLGIEQKCPPKLRNELRVRDITYLTAGPTPFRVWPVPFGRATKSKRADQRKKQERMVRR